MKPENLEMPAMVRLREIQWKAIGDIFRDGKLPLVVTTNGFLAFKVGSGLTSFYAPIANLRGLL